MWNHDSPHIERVYTDIATCSLVPFPVDLHYRLYTLPPGHCRTPQCLGLPTIAGIPVYLVLRSMVIGSRREHLGRLGRGAEPCRHRGIPTIRVLYCDRMPLFH